MKRLNLQRRFHAGISLVETIVSMGVLAVAIPLVLAAVLKSVDTSSVARGETRATSIADYCLTEIRAAREGRSAYLDPIDRGAEFPAGGGVMALAFGRDGAVIGELSPSQFEEGLTRLDGQEVYYVAQMFGRVEPSDATPLVAVTVEVGNPASRRQAQRNTVSFHTKLP